MSKETMSALPCPGCDVPIHFLPYHVPHCPNSKQSIYMLKMKEKGVGTTKITQVSP